jgi:predicted nucleic acid-binding protein
MMLYLDTSALVKLFVEESGSQEVRTATRSAAATATSRIAYVEFMVALARREREGLPPTETLAIRRQFEADWSDLMVVEVTRTITIKAAALARVHRLRAYDAVHLASAQEIYETVPEVVFACFDVRLNEAAKAQSLRLLGE